MISKKSSDHCVNFLISLPPETVISIIPFYLKNNYNWENSHDPPSTPWVLPIPIYLPTFCKHISFPLRPADERRGFVSSWRVIIAIHQHTEVVEPSCPTLPTAHPPSHPPSHPPARRALNFGNKRGWISKQPL